MSSSRASGFLSIHPGDVIARAQTSNFHVLRIPLQLDLESLQQRLRQSQTGFPWLTKDKLRGYRGLGLHYSNFDQRFTDAIDASSQFESDPSGGYPRVRNLRPFQMYEKINEAGHLFESLFLRLHPLKTFRSRLLTIEPGFEMKAAHVDGDVSVRIHIPLETNPDAWIEVEGTRYHLPADGSGYLVNTSLYHRVGNHGESDRTHFVAMIYPRFPNLLHPLAQQALISFIVDTAEGSKPEIDRSVQQAESEAKGQCQICRQSFKRLYVVPLPSTRLKALCAQCIEDVGRKTIDPSTVGATSETAFSANIEKAIDSRF